MRYCNKLFGWLLAVCMIISMLPVSILAVEFDQDLEIKLETEVWEMPELQTSGSEITTFALDSNGNPQLKSTNEVRWIDRIADLPTYATDFYAWLVENSDGDGSSDALIDPTTATTLDGNYVYPIASFIDIPLTFNYATSASKAEIEAAVSDAVSKITSINMENVSAYAVTVFSAFDRDHPEVFWLSGASKIGSSASYSYTYGSGKGSITLRQNVVFYLKQGSSFDVRDVEYRSASTIRSAISSRNSAVNSITSGATGDRQAKIQYLNNWITKHNCYNTSSNLDNISADCRNCIGALEGSVGTAGPVCEGYAKAFKVLCDAVNIPCVLVNGSSGDKKAHMWNYVQMEDGKWYAVDCTWNDPTVKGVTGAVSGFENENYLLAGRSTVIDGTTFANSHLVTNTVTNGGVAFVNGPVLASEDYTTAKLGAEVTNLFGDLNFGPYALKGAIIDVAGYEIPLINLEANITLELAKGSIKIVKAEKDKIQILFGYDQSLDAEINGDKNSTTYWSESYKEVKNLYQNLTGKKVDTTRLWNKFSSLRGKLKKMDASMLVNTDTLLAGYAELTLEDGTYTLSEAGMLASFEIDNSFRHYYGPCYVALGLEAGVDGKLYFTEVNNKFPIQISVEPSLTIAGGGGIGTKNTYAQIDVYGTLMAIIATQAKEPFRAGVDLGARWYGYIIGQEIFNDSKSFLKKELYPDFGDAWEASTFSLIPGTDVSNVDSYNALINAAEPISRDYLSASYGLNRTGIYENASFAKENAYPLSKPNLVSFGDDTMLLVWIDDTGEKTDENMCSLMYSYFNGTSWSDPAFVHEDGTTNDMPNVYSDGRYAYIVWQKATQVFTADVDTTERLKNFDIFVTVFDSKTGSLIDPICVTPEENTVFEFNPVIYGNAGEFRVAWIENSDNNVYQMSGTNRLRVASFSADGIVSESDVVQTTSNIFTDVSVDARNLYYSVLESDSNNLYCHSTDTYLLKKGINDIDYTGGVLFYSDSTGFYSFDGKNTVKYSDIGAMDSFQICNSGSEYVLLTTILKEDFTKALYYSRLSGENGNSWTGFEVFSDNGTYIRDYAPVVLSDNTVHVAFNHIVENKSTDTQRTAVVVGECTDQVDIEVAYASFDDEKLSTGSIELVIGVENLSSRVMESFSVQIIDPNGTVVYEDTAIASLLPFSYSELSVAYNLPENYNNELYIIRVVPVDFSDIYEENNLVSTTFEAIQEISNEPIYGVPVFDWTKDNACTAIFTRVDGAESLTISCVVTHETTPATETEDGATVYTATVEFDGQIYIDTKTVVIPATGLVVLGDVNSDGKVNTQDRTILARYLAKWSDYPESVINMKAADVNSDGKVNTQDRTILARHLAKWTGYETLGETA